MHFVNYNINLTKTFLAEEFNYSCLNQDLPVSSLMA